MKNVTSDNKIRITIDFPTDNLPSFFWFFFFCEKKVKNVCLWMIMRKCVLSTTADGRIIANPFCEKI
jgi:hypothetical protein